MWLNLYHFVVAKQPHLDLNPHALHLAYPRRQPHSILIIMNLNFEFDAHQSVGGLPAFGQTTLPRLLSKGGNGFVPAVGFHIYTELRMTDRLDAAESDEKAHRYLRFIEDYAASGHGAAGIFGVQLLELQGNVLHFFKEGGLDSDGFRSTIQFVYLFTTVLYESLRGQMGEDWQGFASCVDHGSGLIVRHATYGADSTVTLSPAANRPAKRLLSGATPSGHIEYPSAWSGAEVHASDWVGLNLRDRVSVPMLSEIEHPTKRAALQQLVAGIRAKKNPARRAIEFLRPGTAFQPGVPTRMVATSVRCDLDGFSKMVAVAVAEGGSAIREIAEAFAEIMRFGDQLVRATPGTIQLPWAGDCATAFVPDNTGQPSLAAWLDFCIKWQGFATNGSDSISLAARRAIGGAKWAIGACRGERGLILSAPVSAGDRLFRIGAGWPVSTSLDAQDAGRGDEIVIHSEDYAQLGTVPRRLFTKMQDTEYWKGTKITREKLADAATEAGKATSTDAAAFLSKASTIQIPRSRPHLRR